VRNLRQVTFRASVSSFSVKLSRTQTLKPSFAGRFAVALLFALIAGGVAWHAQYVAHAGGSDHVILQRAAQLFLSGKDPYQLDPTSQVPALFWRFFYPLPSIVLGLPFVWLTPEQAAIGFVVCSSWLFGFAVTRDGYERVPIILSVSFLAAAQFAQSTPLVLALALVPVTRGLAMLKPNIGLAVFAWRPAWRDVGVAAAIFLIPLIFWTDWPRRWLISVRSSPAHHAPALVGIGAFALLAALRWRRPEARLLFAMTVIPHGLYFYDELPLWLIADSRREAIALTVSSWLGWLAWNIASPGPQVVDSSSWSVASIYIPALVMVLRRPNQGAVPTWIEQVASQAPPWIRGSAT